MPAFELPPSFELPDVLQPGRPDTRPIRRAVDLFRDHASPQEWDALCEYVAKAFTESTSQRGDRKVMSLMAMILGDWNNIKSTEGMGRVQEGRYVLWAVWVQTEAPEWYRELLRRSLEMWALQIPAGPDQNNLRKIYQTFAVECGSLVWGWDNHNDADRRITKLQAEILQIDTPRRGWTAEERDIFQANYEVSFLSHLDEPPPSNGGDDKIKPAEEKSRRKTSNAIEKAAMQYVDSTFPNIDNADVTAWPIEPQWLLLRANNELHRILMVFRYNGAVSRIPRVARAFGSMQVMGRVNELECDSSHPLFAGMLQFSQLRRVLLFDMRGANTTLVRTWVNVNRNTDQQHDLLKHYYLADNVGMRRVKPDVYTKAKNLKSKK